jgi:hypothetical protein
VMSSDALSDIAGGNPEAQARQSISTATLATVDSDSKSRKGRHLPDFVSKNGSRHHRYEPDKAPWPLCYDPEYL